MLPRTATRVAENTPPHLNDRILDRTAESIARVTAQGVDAIHQRLDELDAEWDVERAFEAHAAAAVLLGLFLGKTKHKAFYAVPALIGGFLMQHALQGWYPLVRPLRALGFRTPREIEDERHALLAELQRLSARR